MRDYANYLRSDDAVTDDFLSEGVTFEESLELMDKVADAVDQYVDRHLTA